MDPKQSGRGTFTLQTRLGDRLTPKQLSPPAAPEEFPACQVPLLSKENAQDPFPDSAHEKEPITPVFEKLEDILQAWTFNTKGLFESEHAHDDHLSPWCVWPLCFSLYLLP